MDSIKLFRFSIPGGIFLIATLFMYIYSDGLFCKIPIAEVDGNGYVSKLIISIIGIIITLFFSTPIIGLIISTIGHFIIYQLFGYKLYFNIPNPKKNKDEFDAFFNYFITLYESGNENISALKDDFIKKYFAKNKLKRFFIKKYHKTLFYYYQLVARDHMTEQFLHFSEKRWGMFWTQYNIFISIILGSIFGYCLSEIISVNNGYKQDTFNKCHLLIVCIIYLIITIWQIFHIREKNSIIEHYWLIHKGKSKIPYKNPTHTSF